MCQRHLLNFLIHIMTRIFSMRLISCFIGIVLLLACGRQADPLKPHRVFINDVQKNKKGFYYLGKSVKNGSREQAIGIFDSGIGGLSVLHAIITADNFNSKQQAIPDGLLDFCNESFIYFADQANMPYSNYVEVGKKELLVEHVFKDALFLLNRRYHNPDQTGEIVYDKPTVKSIVIACNTATAFGKDRLVDFFERNGINIHVVGVIDAGAMGALDLLKKDENAVIAVFATPATVKSGAYVNVLHDLIYSGGFSGKIKIVQHGGKGLHEAIDQKPEFINESASGIRASYQGPSFSDAQYPIDTSLLDVYHFDTAGNHLLYNKETIMDSDTLQLNSIENYVRYHIVSLVREIQLSGSGIPLRALILGCTHYPFAEDVIEEVLDELRHQDEFRSVLADSIVIIDPAENTAIELYRILAEQGLLHAGDTEQTGDASFYISVPNIHLADADITDKGTFSYSYQYLTRDINMLQDFTLLVPFSREVIHENQLKQIEAHFPETFNLIMQDL
jgi:glutamate racemase